MTNVAPFSEWSDGELWSLRTELQDPRPGHIPYAEQRHDETDSDGRVIPGGPNLADWYLVTLSKLDEELAARGLRLVQDRWELPHERDARVRRHIHAVSE